MYDAYFRFWRHGTFEKVLNQNPLDVMSPTILNFLYKFVCYDHFSFASCIKRYLSLNETQISSFRQNGHILLPQVVSREEMQVLRPVINEAAYKYNTEKRKMEERDTYGKAFLQIMNLWEQDAQVKAFTLARRFARLAAQLLGVEAVRLYHDQALYKEPKGGHTPWHQDQYYWPLDTSNTITLWMPLIDITEDLGMLTFASGSHRGRYDRQPGHLRCFRCRAGSVCKRTRAIRFTRPKPCRPEMPRFITAGPCTPHREIPRPILPAK
jgi:hypothetical protein